VRVKRTRQPSSMRPAPIAEAMWVLPVPDEPTAYCPISGW
jgi:hypothetical protein